MGSGPDTDALLIFGYDLGGESDGFLVKEVDDSGSLIASWAQFGRNEDFITAAMSQLSHAGVVEESWWRNDMPVVIKAYCSRGYPKYVIGTKAIRVKRGHTATIDPEELVRTAIGGGAPILGEALRALGLTPHQAAPAWLLVSYWDIDD